MTDLMTLTFAERLTDADARRLWKHIAVRDPNECWLWQGYQDPSGHGQIKCFGRSGQSYKAHRVAYTVAYGPIPEGMIVRHRCDTPACCNPAHLVLGTHADNVRDRVIRGRSATGYRNGRSKLTPKQVVTIRQRLAEGGRSLQSLATEYNVDRKTIRLIRDGVTWKD